MKMAAERTWKPTLEQMRNYRKERRARQIAKGQCVDCSNPSHKFKRCLECRQRELAAKVAKQVFVMSNGM